MILLSGTQLSQDLLANATDIAAGLPQKPCLATVLVGEDPASATYVRMKRNRAAAAGIDAHLVHLPAATTTAELVATIQTLSTDPDVHGILLQHPVPAHIDERAAFEAIHPAKDVDGVTLHSFAAMAFGLPGFPSATPGAIMALLDHYGVPLSGKHAVVVGRSPILGKPVGMLLLARDATVTFCHSRTTDLTAHLQTADIVVAAVGKPRFITGDQLREGVVVIDAGYNPGNVGDVDFDTAARKASMITPVPGGIGPVTIATLLHQTVTAAANQLA
ncbi:MAG TPA: bifunctional 5,10-methylenetetrahydrofolate dehydrogenase/5,10-methenyltetrahydrofolate cyclohydrolase [Candidatus Limnocylindrales bacterium]|nr:bifunctional 5,10-methylenetetrahydrofolate dehydrogenase/5,10-methenyltetrahydrofolate cyclohydrolase [Candidatus Limnocylindrales bacterium]